MGVKGREPSFVHHGSSYDGGPVGEFHYGSASDPQVLEPGKGIKTFLTDPPYNLGFDYGPEVDDKKPEECTNATQVAEMYRNQAVVSSNAGGGGDEDFY